jgi:predicted transposase YdaD
MLQLHDIRESRVFQEAREEGMKEERERHLQEKLRSVTKWAALNVSAEDIARILEMDIVLVREQMSKKPT